MKNGIRFKERQALFRVMWVCAFFALCALFRAKDIDPLDSIFVLNLIVFITEMKYFSSIFLTLAALQSVYGCDTCLTDSSSSSTSSNIPQPSQFTFGKANGSKFSYQCPINARMVQVSVRSDNYIRAMKFFCSDGSSSDWFGSEGDYPETCLDKVGSIVSMDIAAGDWIDRFGYNGRSAGGQGGQTNAIPKQSCPLLAVEGTTNGVMITSLTTKFACSNVYGSVRGTDKIFMCPPQTQIAQLKGSSDKFINQLQIVCSDGTTSPMFGTMVANSFSLEYLQSGIRQFKVRSGGRVDSIGYSQYKTGGNGGYEYTVGDNTCPAAGMRIFYDDVVRGVGIYFKCY